MPLLGDDARVDHSAAVLVGPEEGATLEVDRCQSNLALEQ